MTVFFLYLYYRQNIYYYFLDLRILFNLRINNIGSNNIKSFIVYNYKSLYIIITELYVFLSKNNRVICLRQNLPLIDQVKHERKRTLAI